MVATSNSEPSSEARRRRESLHRQRDATATRHASSVEGSRDTPEVRDDGSAAKDDDVMAAGGAAQGGVRDDRHGWA
jgi:hypothetical protein